jgi:ParB family chromosome partitioning protein
MSADRSSKGLGKGLSALLGDAARPGAAEAQASTPGGVREIDISRIRPNTNQPRVMFSDESIAELAESIAERGVLQPILLRPTDDGFEIVAGERRWRAAQRARLHTIPAIVREIDATTTAELALIENVQREDLNAIEEAEAYRKLIDRFGHSQEELGRLVHKSRSHIANLLRLLDLPALVRAMLADGRLSMGHARALITAPDPVGLAVQVVERGLSVRETERLAQAARPAAARPAQGQKEADADIAALERQLGDILGLRVKISYAKGAGTVTLGFSSLDQLDLICQRLTGERI